MSAPFDLDRFVQAQDPVLAAVRHELSSGRKRSHWIWFVFPQLAGLGRSDRARRYAIGSLAEAGAYLAHPVLGARLVECAALVNAVQGRSALEILGTPDDLKFRSSMTLFAAAGPGQAVFVEALRRFFDGVADPATTRLLAGPQARRCACGLATLSLTCTGLVSALTTRARSCDPPRPGVAVRLSPSICGPSGSFSGRDP